MCADGVPQWVRLCELSALPTVGARGFDLRAQGVDDIFVVRQYDLLRGYRNSCPHWPGATLPWCKHGYLDPTMQYIVCHGHGARFTLDDGLCVLGPCLGQTLEAIPLRIEEDAYLSAYLPLDDPAL
ncbi:Rieske 2Fe-2S domain-containing protein [Paraburkholderia sp. BL17N1]|nr:Rieske 2Fe-2S domain-containing protein [Paraburkholderia sp. BL17N1]REE19356.1 nitrite reductase/ring-hydroxylating ferredoxin subunit [Paraburkholderia sp. BL27I4N3]RKR45165.1 nitrite reductase/ring-hydroxylating ferredoxin subunit [Paraburkholderia sp. BL17N1]